MAPFSRLCAFALSLGAPQKNGVNNKSSLQPRAWGTKYSSSSEQRHGRHYSQTLVSSLAQPSDVVLEDSVSLFSDESAPTPDVDLSHLAELLGATPQDLLSLKTTSDGVRGVYLNHNVAEDDVILSIPLDSCLHDDKPPEWFVEAHSDNDDDESPVLQPGAWATRLAACLIDKQQSPNDGMDEWFSLLPDTTLFAASLPIHWDEAILSDARCTALELAVDSAYFTRADAIADLKMALQDNENQDDHDVCQHALDLVQTRSCRVETSDGTPIRLLAPIFDFINHDCTPNAVFALEDDTHLVVRATRNLLRDEQVLIDYGDSARPHWKCLASYGFVPEYNQEDDNEDDVAEVYVHGRRFEVGKSTIPVDLVEAVEAHAENEGFYERPEVEEAPETVLTPDIAMRIAKRVSEVAFQLLLDSNHDDYEELAQFYEDAVDKQEYQQAPEDVISARLAASLRFAQHRTLLACSNGLIDWAAGQLDSGQED